MQLYLCVFLCEALTQLLFIRLSTQLKHTVWTQAWQCKPGFIQAWAWSHQQSGAEQRNCKFLKLLQFLPKDIEHWPECHCQICNKKKPDKQVNAFCYARQSVRALRSQGNQWAPNVRTDRRVADTRETQALLPASDAADTRHEEFAWGDRWTGRG